MAKKTDKDMADDEGATTSEAEIAVHWREEGYYFPSAKFIGQANASDPAICERFGEKNYPECFKEYADLLDWDEYWHTTLDTSNAPFWKWFVGGKLNASYNCVDRHLKKDRNKAAIILGPRARRRSDRGDHLSGALRPGQRIRGSAEGLRGLRRPVTWRPSTCPWCRSCPVAMLACARLGVVHSQVFGGFSGAACGGRIADSQSKMLVTMDGYYRNGVLLDHKVKADEAVARAARRGRRGEKVLVFRRRPGEYASREPDGRGPGLLRRRDHARVQGQARRAGLDARRGAAVHHVLERDDRQAQGLPAQHRRLPRLRDRDVEVLPGHPSRGHLLVRRRHRLDHRTLLHRLRAAVARHDDGDVRGRADVSRRRTCLADRRAPRRDDLPHRARRRSGCCARSAPTSQRSTTTTSST